MRGGTVRTSSAGHRIVDTAAREEEILAELPSLGLSSICNVLGAIKVVIAHPHGFELMPEVVERAEVAAVEAGASITFVHDMDEAFEGGYAK
jgi:hypothetical protein